MFHSQWEGARIRAEHAPPARGANGISTPDATRSSCSRRRLSAHELLRKVGRASRKAARQIRLGHSGRNRHRPTRVGSPKATPAVTADQVPRMLRTGALSRRDVPIDQRFHIGQRVRARNINPTGHTRLPRYARGKTGEIHPRPRRVRISRHQRAVPGRKSAARLFGPLHRPRAVGQQASPRDAVYIDMWDDYLEPA